MSSGSQGLSERTEFRKTDWSVVPDKPGVYVIYDLTEVIYVGMAGRNGKGSLRRRLRDHSTGQVVNMFAQYLFLARVQFQVADRITHPKVAKEVCRAYIAERCSFQYQVCKSSDEARKLEQALKAELQPALNP